MDTECPICYCDYEPSKRAVKPPCGHTMCDACIDRMKGPRAEGSEGAFQCPYCRFHFRLLDCQENLQLQEEAYTAAASHLKYPFPKATCSICSQSASFADLYVCYSCHPTLMGSVFNFEPEKMMNKFICLTCEAKHHPIHAEAELPIATLPVTIYTTENITEIAHQVGLLFCNFLSNVQIAPFAIGLIASALARIDRPVISQSLAQFIVQTAPEFLERIREQTEREEVRNAGRLFLRSYWAILEKFPDVLDPAILEMEWAVLTMKAVGKAAMVDFVVHDADEDDPSPYLMEVAVAEFVWGKCSKVLEAIWRRVLAEDKAQMGKNRVDGMMQLLSLCLFEFKNADTIDFLDEIVGNERRTLMTLQLPHWHKGRIAGYKTRMEEAFDKVEMQCAEREMSMIVAQRQFPNV